MKKGLTLAEILITLAIIGVIAAIGAPAINKLMPNKNEEMFFKAYDTLRETVRDLASNSRIYPACSNYLFPFGAVEFDNYKTDKYPLFNLNLPVDDDMLNIDNVDDCVGEEKLCNLLGDVLNGENIDCSGFDGAKSDDDVIDLFHDNEISFKTPNGMKWFIYPTIPINYDNGNDNINFAIEAWVDVDSSNNNVNNADNSCMIKKNANGTFECTNPDIFKLWITADGNIIAADLKAQEYLSKRAKITFDIDDADEIVIGNINNINRDFHVEACN